MDRCSDSAQNTVIVFTRVLKVHIHHLDYSDY